MTTTSYLVDTSALARLLQTRPELATWDEQIEAGLLGVCPITELELLFVAQSSAHRTDLLETLQESYSWILMPEAVYQRAAEVQALLTKRGHHRSAGPVDLLVAATAELNGLTLLHYDNDFETLAAATGQPARWLAKPGSIP